jgi:sRNA-binding carbon storage regulator CsrA
MRDNLIFYGISETTGANISQENCADLVKNFIKDHLKIDASNMIFDRAHRLGSETGRSSPRPIIVKLHYYQERETVRKTSINVRDELKRLNIGVGVQLPKEWREARKELYPIMQAEKRKGNSVKFVGERLLINGVSYTKST